MAIRYFDMFSGIGGFRSGLEKLGGFECVGHCEIDKSANQAYCAIYNPEGECYYEDATKIDPNTMPDFDLLCGGFPCQAFSIAGRRGGFDDARGTLFFEIARIAAVKQPNYLFLENVPGLLSHDGGRTFATILSTLDELGYDVTWQVLNSKDFGVPQARKRVYIVGYLRANRTGQILSFRETSSTALRQIMPGGQGDRVYSPDGTASTLTSEAGGFGGKTGLYHIGLPIKVKTKSGYQIAQIGDSIDIAYDVSNTRRGRVGKQVAHTVTCSPTQAAFIDLNEDPKITTIARCVTTRQDAGIGKHKAERSGVLVIDPEPDDPAILDAICLIVLKDKEGKEHLGAIRRLMPIECWRLQGFTDEQFHKAEATGLGDGQLYKLAGNAVSVPVISAVGQVIKAVEEAHHAERKTE